MIKGQANTFECPYCKVKVLIVGGYDIESGREICIDCAESFEDFADEEMGIEPIARKRE